MEFEIWERMIEMEEAIKKLQAEIGASPKNQYVKLIGEFLIKHVQSYPDTAGRIMAEGKTITKSLDAMKTEAKKKAVNGMAMLTDEEVFEIVLKYFGFDVKQSKSKQSEASAGFDVSLDEILGGL